MKKYLVACDNEDSWGRHTSYSGYDIIEAESPKEAVEKYDIKHECTYFTGVCLGEVNEEAKTATIPLKHFIRNYK